LVEVKQVRKAVEGLDRVGNAFEELLNLQGVLNRLQDQFAQLDEDLFEGRSDRLQLWQELVRDGFLHALATQLQAGQDISFVRLQMANKHLGHRTAIAQWTTQLQSGLHRLRPRAVAAAADDDDVWADAEDSPRGQSRTVYEQVRAQQVHIIEQLKRRHLDDARQFTELLIEQQRATSRPEQIAKSLSLLAQQAKRQEVPELQLEWARWATKENPVDPKTFGHLADALIAVGQYHEAEEAFDAVEAAGGRFFAETGRARILSALGRYDEARSKFIAAAQEFEGQEGEALCWSHAADCLRDIGKGDQAVGEYQELTKQFPLTASVWTGYGYALLEIGRIDDAIVNFGRALANGRDLQAVAGRASALRQAGRFSDALPLYDQILTDYPNNSNALCGRAEVFRLKGQFEAALTAYDIAIERCPFSAFPFNGKASVLLEMGEYTQAHGLFEAAYAKFPTDSHAISGLIRATASLDRLQDALTLADTHLSQTPRAIGVRIQRAKLLARMGQVDSALIALDTLAAEHPTNVGVLTAKANLLIGANRVAEASLLLPDAWPKTQLEWNRYLLRILVIQEQRGPGAASIRLHRALTSCPFFAQRKLLRSALASIELNRGRNREARRIVESAPAEVSNVISLHVFARAHRPGQARQIYHSIIASHPPAIVISLVEEIARRTGLVDAAPQFPTAWITQQERLDLLRNAA